MCYLEGTQLQVSKSWARWMSSLLLGMAIHRPTFSKWRSTTENQDLWGHTSGAPALKLSSQDANNHRISSLGGFMHVKHPEFSHSQLFIFQFYHIFCVNISLWSRLRLLLILSQLVCLPLFITLLPPFLKIATQLNLWSDQPLFTLHLCRKGKKPITAPSPQCEGWHWAGLSWSQTHFTEKFWQISFQYMRKRGIQKFRLKHFR